MWVGGEREEKGKLRDEKEVLMGEARAESGERRGRWLRVEDQLKRSSHYLEAGVRDGGRRSCENDGSWLFEPHQTRPLPGAREFTSERAYSDQPDSRTRSPPSPRQFALRFPPPPHSTLISSEVLTSTF